MQNIVHHQLEHTGKIEFSTYICDTFEKCPSLHFHKNFEMLLVIDGECDLTLSGHVYRLKKGEAAFILPFQIHKFSIQSNSSVRCTTFHEHLILTLSRALDGKRAKTPIFYPSRSIFDFFLYQTNVLFGSDSGLQIRIEPPSKRNKVKGLLYIIESEFLEQAELISTKGVEAVTMTVVQYITENFQQNISLKDAAQAMGYNYQYLSRTFNDIIGINFKKLLNQYRMEHAYAMLQDTDLPISRIAFESGFQSIRSFDHVCKEIFNSSPKELRKKHMII